MALPLVLKTEAIGLTKPLTLKAVDADEFIRNGWPPNRCMLLLDQVQASHRAALMGIDWAAVMAEDISSLQTSAVIFKSPAPREAVSPGDVVEATPGRQTIRVLYRRGERGNVLFVTERCNSFCLMCSQPPRQVADDWRVTQNLDLIELIDHDEASLAITGGEPTLLGDGLVRIIARCAELLPQTDLQILSNGRKISVDLSRATAEVKHPKLQWNIPLYGDVAPIHDYVVQSKGAFHETISGLYRLAEAGNRIEIRVVLHKATIPRLQSLARYIYRNLSFVQHVALMGLEPIGLARANREALWIDPVDYQDELQGAVDYLEGKGMRVSIYNLPRCVLRPLLWGYAQQSISDWKNIFVPECEGCSQKGLCAGFFASTDKKWTSRGIRPIGPMGGSDEIRSPAPV